MRKVYFLLLTLLLNSTIIFAQSSWLAPEEGYITDELISDKSFTSFDVKNNILYGITDDEGLFSYDITNESLIRNYGTPDNYAEPYSTFNSFLTLSPDGDKIWVGYTNFSVSDDRIYTVDVATGDWTHEATMSANFDLEIYEDKIFVSGLNSGNWDGVNDINCVWLLDTSGDNNHQKIIEIGGNSPGLSIDKDGNIIIPLYDPNNSETFLYRWSKGDIDQIISSNDGSFLKISDSETLTTMPPNGPYDCAVDDANNLIFNCNDFTNGSFLAVWNETIGNSENYDVIATYGGSSFAWFGMIKADGDIKNGGRAYTTNFGDPVSYVQLLLPPQLTKPLGEISEVKNAQDSILSLNDYFENSYNNIVYSVEFNSKSSVASAVIQDDELTISFLQTGQTTVFIKAEANGKSTVEKLIIGVYPNISGDFTVTDFENFTLDENTAWDGVIDEFSSFESGLTSFSNYKSDWSWEGWAYSNVTDNTTPGYGNQFSAIAGSGFNSANYGVGYVGSDWTSYEPIPLSFEFKDGASYEVEGLFITNSTYSALTMQDGDDFTMKFGGEDGTSPDYFKLIIWGEKDGNKTSDEIDFYLADYRFEDDREDYIIKTWQWVDLSSLGEVDKVYFSVESSDVGEYGINTPTYFNIDNIYVANKIITTIKEENSLSVIAYPNPIKDVVYIATENGENAKVNIYNIQGNVVYSDNNYVSESAINFSNLPSGQYILQIIQNESVVTKIVLK